MMSNEYIIQTNNLTKAYKGINVLDNLNLNVPKGSIFGFLGPNGAGKTTTMKLMLGFITPTSGGASVFGKDIIKDSIYIRSRLGYLSQDPRFYGHLSARENLRFVAGFFYKGLKVDIDKRVDEMLDLVGLSDKADRPIKGFSGGELQRLGIAQAQINEPDLLILDEPMASLDPIGRKEILGLMEQLRERTTIFYSTHILADVQRISDTVAILNKGKLMACGNIQEFVGGGTKVIYEVAVRGNVEKECAQISSLRWVSDVRSSKQGQETNLTIHVSDRSIAEMKLLRMLLANENVVVTEFKRKQYELEEAFMNIVGGVE